MNTVETVDSTEKISNYASTKTQDATEEYGKTIGKPQLSDKAAAYYESLKKKYSSMDFILVSEDMKQQAQARASSFSNPNKMVVLIDEAKIEQMATDENFRKKYEDVIKSASVQLPQLQNSLSSSSTNVRCYGMKVNDNGTASFFVVIDKSLALQKERIEKKAEEKKDTKKAEQKKIQKEEQKKRLEETLDDKKKALNTATEADDGTITLEATSIESLMNKLNDLIFDMMSDSTETEAEKKVGHNFDLSL